MTMRGIRQPRSRTVTSAVGGQLLDPATRAEAATLLAESRLFVRGMSTNPTRTGLLTVLERPLVLRHGQDAELDW